MFPGSKIATFAFVIAATVAVAAQDTKKFSGSGIGFDYSASWHLSQKAAKEADEIALTNAEFDAQITVVSVRKPLESKEMADARKRAVDPWLESLQKTYSSVAGITLVRSDIKIEAGGQTTDGAQFKFSIDGQGGAVETYWLLLEKKLVMVYMIRPDRTAEKVVANWDLIRKSLHLTEQKK